MLRLRTFGGLWVEAPPGASNPTVTPRRLALLAVVAASGRRGVSRDKLLGILWPDKPEELGRHALSQTLYSLRRDLGVDAVTGSSDLHLDPARLSSDVGDFLAAGETGNRTVQAPLYTGPFLEGFYLPETPEFERWAEGERERLEHQARELLLALAHAEESQGHHREAANWLQRLTALEPLSSDNALRYMRALAASGDRAGALAHARKYEEVVRRELETDPEPEVTELVKRLRREKPVGGGLSGKLARPAATPPEPMAAPGEAPTPASVRKPRPRWMLIGTATVVAALFIGLLTRSKAPETTPLLAVGQIRDAAARDTAPTGVLTDMLATNLARVRGLQVVANSRLFELMKPGEDSARGAFSEAARRAGARQILEGEISYAREGGLLFDLRRIDLRSGVVRQGYRVRGLDRYALIDSATAAVARDFALESPGSAIAEVSTSSPMAYRFYEEGLRSYFQYDVAAAFRLMKSALEEDSTFAIAAYYAWLAGNGVLPNGGEPYLDLAVRLAPKAPDRERLLILGRARAYREDPAAVFPAESLAIRFPSDPGAQWLRGIMASMKGDYAVAIEALNRAIALDSAASFISGEACRACESFLAMISVFESWDSAGAAERTGRRWLRLQPSSTSARMALAEAIARQGRWNEVYPLLRGVDSLEPRRRDFRQIEMYYMMRREDYRAVERAAQAIVLHDPDQELRIDALWLWIIGLRNQGRLRDADGLLQGRLPDGGSFTRPVPGALLIPAATVAFESGNYVAAIALYHQQADDNWENPHPGHRARGASWNLTLESTAIAAKGDTARLRGMADSIERVGRQSLFGRSPRLHYFIRGVLLARQGRHAEAVPEYRRAVISWSDGFTRINYELARSLLALNRPADAVLALRPALRGAIDASNLYLTRTEIHELLAQAFEAAGQRDSSVAHYRAVARAWENADPQFRDRYLRAKERAGRPVSQPPQP